MLKTVRKMSWQKTQLWGLYKTQDDSKTQEGSVVSENLAVVIFSFNRGKYLLNVLRSVWEMMPPRTKVYVFDDGSTDVPTRVVLDFASSAGCLVKISGNTRAGGRGGLLAMMQDALRDIEEDYVILLQDDMQLVRPISKGEKLEMVSFLEQSPHPIAWTNFLREIDISRGSGETVALSHSAEFGDENHFYIKNSAGDIRSYSHVGLFNLKLLRTRKQAWSFESEPFKLRHWSKEFGDMPAWRNPFSAQLPWPESWRKRRKTVAHAMWDSYHAGFHPLAPMAESAQVRLMNRDHLSDPAYYGEYLLCFDSKIRTPWRHHGFTDAPRWVRALSAAEDLVYWRKNRG